MIIKRYSMMTCSTEPDSNLVFADFHPNVKMDLAAARESVMDRLEFTQNKKHFLILDVTNVRQLTAEAREYLLRPDAGLKNILGAAFTGNNPVAALLANIFIKSPKNFPTRFFSSREAAVAWIEQYKIKVLTE